MGLTLLAHASLQLVYLDNAFLTSVYRINKLPASTLNYEVHYTNIFGKPQDYQFVRIFGCSCSPFLRPYNKHKLDFHSQEYVLR